MDVSVAIYVLGATGFFPVRAFVPAFVVAAFLRLDHYVSWLVPDRWLALSAHAPAWFTSDTSLISLFGLSLAELWATKNSDVREYVSDALIVAKPIMGAMTTVGLLSSADADIVSASAAWRTESFALMVGQAAAVLGLSRARRRTLEALIEHDPDDSMMIQQLLSWLEEFWAFGGMALLILLPSLTLGLAAAAIIALLLIEHRIRRSNEARRTACAHCGAMIFPVAPTCGSCGAAAASACRIGVLDRFIYDKSADAHFQGYRLLANGRCGICAERFDRDTIRCPNGHAMFHTPRDAMDYAHFVDRGRWKVYLACLLVGLIPVLGGVASLLIFRIWLIAPFRRLLRSRLRLMTRICISVLTVLVLATQWLPTLGAFELLALAWLSRHIYREAFLAQHGPRWAGRVEADVVPKSM